MEKSTPVMYSAPWVLPVAGPPIRNGAVAVREGRIAAAGPVTEIRAQFSGWEEIGCRGILMPALINAHIHLELSHLTGISPPAPGGTMCDWIAELIRSRNDCLLTVDEKQQFRQAVLLDQYRAGVILLADIGNEPCLAGSGTANLPFILHFQEFLGPTKTATDAAAATIAGLPDTAAATAHAPYSTSPELFRLLKNRARRLDRIFPVHVAESREEIEFLQSASGGFQKFLEGRGAWDGTFPSPGMHGAEVVMYLDQLDVLDEKTLCVHCVHVTEKELELLAGKGAPVCVCPGSNRFLQVGRAPVELMLLKGLLPAIGTDSIASNQTLDMWREMQILREEHPDVEAAKVLEMATLGGALALHCHDDLGSLAPGCKAIFLEVNNAGLADAGSGKTLLDVLTRGGRPQVVSWIQHENTAT